MTFDKLNYENEVVLSLLKRESHGRELAKNLKTSLTRVQAVLKKLRRSNVVDYRTEGRNHVFFIKHNLVSRSFILNAEHYKLIVLLRKHDFLEPLLDEVLRSCPAQMILLFGSYAKGMPKEDSDIDLFVETSDRKIKESIQRINDKFSVKIGDFREEDLLVQEIIKDHVIIRGGERFYEKLGFFG